MLKRSTVKRNILMAKLITAHEAARGLGLKYEAFLRRVRIGDFKAKRVGWAVVMTRAQYKAAEKKVLKCS